jgi:hypothetical protein
MKRFFQLTVVWSMVLAATWFLSSPKAAIYLGAFGLLYENIIKHHIREGMEYMVRFVVREAVKELRGGK